MTKILAEGTIFKIQENGTTKGWAFAETRAGNQRQYWLLNGIDKPLPGSNDFTIDVHQTGKTFGQFIDFARQNSQSNSKFLTCTVSEYSSFSSVPAADQANWWNTANGTHIVETNGQSVGRATYMAASSAGSTEYWTLSPSWVETGRKDLKDGTGLNEFTVSGDGDSFVVVESTETALP